jgi:hypothetical protein
MLVFKCLSVKIGLITRIRKTLTDFNKGDIHGPGQTRAKQGVPKT